MTSEVQQKKCRFCAEDIKVDASLCRFCNRDQIDAGDTAKPALFGGDPSSDSLIDVKRNLKANDLAVIAMEMAKFRKNILPAYLFWFFLGGIGAHKFYLRSTALGWAYL